MDTQKRKIIDFQDCEVCGLVRPLGFECPFCAVKRLESDIEKLQKMKFQELKETLKLSVKVVPVCLDCGAMGEATKKCGHSKKAIKWMEPDVYDMMAGMVRAIGYAMDKDPNFIEKVKKSEKP